MQGGDASVRSLAASWRHDNSYCIEQKEHYHAHQRRPWRLSGELRRTNSSRTAATIRRAKCCAKASASSGARERSSPHCDAAIARRHRRRAMRASQSRRRVFARRPRQVRKIASDAARSRKRAKRRCSFRRRRRTSSRPRSQYRTSRSPRRSCPCRIGSLSRCVRARRASRLHAVTNPSARSTRPRSVGSSPDSNHSERLRRDATYRRPARHRLTTYAEHRHPR